VLDGARALSRRRISTSSVGTSRASKSSLQRANFSARFQIRGSGRLRSSAPFSTFSRRLFEGPFRGAFSRGPFRGLVSETCARNHLRVRYRASTRSTVSHSLKRPEDTEDSSEKPPTPPLNGPWTRRLRGSRATARGTGPVQPTALSEDGPRTRRKKRANTALFGWARPLSTCTQSIRVTFQAEPAIASLGASSTHRRGF